MKNHRRNRNKEPEWRNEVEMRNEKMSKDAIDTTLEVMDILHDVVSGLMSLDKRVETMERTFTKENVGIEDISGGEG